MKNISKLFTLSLITTLAFSILAPKASANTKPLIDPVIEKEIQNRIAEQQKQFPWTQEEVGQFCQQPEIAYFIAQVENAKTMEEVMAYIDAFKDSNACKNVSKKNKKLLAMIMATVLGEKGFNLSIAQKRA